MRSPLRAGIGILTFLLLLPDMTPGGALVDAKDITTDGNEAASPSSPPPHPRATLRRRNLIAVATITTAILKRVAIVVVVASLTTLTTPPPSRAVFDVAGIVPSGAEMSLSKYGIGNAFTTGEEALVGWGRRRRRRMTRRDGGRGVVGDKVTKRDMREKILNFLQVLIFVQDLILTNIE